MARRPTLKTVHIRVGKHGITPTLIEEIKLQLSTTDPLTVKFMQNFRESNDRKQAVDELVSAVGCRLKSLVGGVAMLTKKQ